MIKKLVQTKNGNARKFKDVDEAVAFTGYDKSLIEQAIEKKSLAYGSGFQWVNEPTRKTTKKASE